MKAELKSFFLAFQISRKIIFEVSYHIDYFSTSAEELNQPKTDYSRCGQAQDGLLKDNTIARFFYKRWDCFHLRPLNKKMYSKLIKEIEMLKEHYNFIESDTDLRFWQTRELSKMKVKKVKVL